MTTNLTSLLEELTEKSRVSLLTGMIAYDPKRACTLAKEIAQSVRSQIVMSADTDQLLKKSKKFKGYAKEIKNSDRVHYSDKKSLNKLIDALFHGIHQFVLYRDDKGMKEWMNQQEPIALMMKNKDAKQSIYYFQILSNLVRISNL